MSGSPVGRLDLEARLKDTERRLEVMERTNRLNNASITSGGLTVKNGGDINVEDAAGNVVWRASENITIYRSASAKVESYDLISDAVFHQATFCDIEIPIGYSTLALQVAVQVGQTVTGTGNSWIGTYATAFLLDINGGNVAASGSSVAPIAYTPFHPNGGPAAPSTFAGVAVSYPPQAVKLRCYINYALSLSGQAKSGGANTGNAVVNAIAMFGRS